MKVKYDSTVDALYVSLAKGIYEKSRKVTDSVLVDEDNKGNILGIEILDASKNVPAFDPKDVKFEVQTRKF